MQFPRLTTNVSQELLDTITKIVGVEVDQTAGVYTP
jgi:hypothetical protein